MVSELIFDNWKCEFYHVQIIKKIQQIPKHLIGKKYYIHQKKINFEATLCDNRGIKWAQYTKNGQKVDKKVYLKCLILPNLKNSTASKILSKNSKTFSNVFLHAKSILCQFIMMILSTFPKWNRHSILGLN